MGIACPPCFLYPRVTMDKVICVGKNYLEHARELGDAVPEKPVLFLKPPSAVMQASQRGQTVKVQLPRARGSVHPEAEIVLKLGASGEILAVTLGLDGTLREEQARLKKAGHPWEISKVFEASAVVGPWAQVEDFRDWRTLAFSLEVNGKLRQRGQVDQMTLSPQACIEHAGTYFKLCEGDLLYTGTPAGVGGVEPGDTGSLKWGGEEWLRIEWT